MCVCLTKSPPSVGSCGSFGSPLDSMVSVLGLQGTALRLRTKVSSLEPGWIAYGDPSN